MSYVGQYLKTLFRYENVESINPSAALWSCVFASVLLKGRQLDYLQHLQYVVELAGRVCCFALLAWVKTLTHHSCDFFFFTTVCCMFAVNDWLSNSTVWEKHTNSCQFNLGYWWCHKGVSLSPRGSSAHDWLPVVSQCSHEATTECFRIPGMENTRRAAEKDKTKCKHESECDCALCLCVCVCLFLCFCL